MESKERQKRGLTTMAAHHILRSVTSDNGVVRESKEGGGSHTQLIHGKRSEADGLTGKSNDLMK
jgi:hypothetical protein